MVSQSAHADFETASLEVSNYFQSRLGFRVWFATQSESDDGIAVNRNDQIYNVENRAKIYDRTDSFCLGLVEGLGTRIVSGSDDGPAHASKPDWPSPKMAAYLNLALCRSNGQTYGELFVIGPHPMPDAVAKDLPLINLTARLLKTIFEKEILAEEEQRNAELAMAEAVTDQLTGLFNRRGWQDLLAMEESRCWRYSLSAGVLSIDLDGLKIVNDEQGHVRGDALLCNAATVLSSVTRQSDVVARLGGDEFAVLVVESDLSGTTSMMNRLVKAFSKAGVSASIGMSMRYPEGSLEDAFEKADKQMYEQKKIRKSQHLVRQRCNNCSENSVL